MRDKRFNELKPEVQNKVLAWPCFYATGKPKNIVEMNKIAAMLQRSWRFSEDGEDASDQGSTLAGVFVSV